MNRDQAEVLCDILLGIRNEIRTLNMLKLGESGIIRPEDPLVYAETIAKRMEDY